MVRPVPGPTVMLAVMQPTLRSAGMCSLEAEDGAALVSLVVGAQQAAAAARSSRRAWSQLLGSHPRLPQTLVRQPPRSAVLPATMLTMVGHPVEDPHPRRLRQVAVRSMGGREAGAGERLRLETSEVTVRLVVQTSSTLLAAEGRQGPAARHPRQVVTGLPFVFPTAARVEAAAALGLL